MLRVAHLNPIAWIPTFRSRGPSVSTSITLCHSPRTRRPRVTGTVSLAPRSIDKPSFLFDHYSKEGKFTVKLARLNERKGNRFCEACLGPYKRLLVC